MSAIITMISSSKNHSYDINLSFEIMSGIRTLIYMGKSQIVTMIYRCLTVVRIIAAVQEPNGLKLF